MWEILRPILLNLLQSYGPMLFNVILGLLGWSVASKASKGRLPGPASVFSSAKTAVSGVTSESSVERSLKEAAKGYIDADDFAKARAELSFCEEYRSKHPDEPDEPVKVDAIPAT